MPLDTTRWNDRLASSITGMLTGRHPKTSSPWASP